MSNKTFFNSNLKMLLGFGLLLVLTVAMALLGSRFVLKSWQKQDSDDTEDEGLQTQKASGDLTFESGEDLAKLLADKNRELQNLAWVDKSQGIVRLPINEAMALLIKKDALRRKASR